jgi:NAD(P)-dependent dehydrogenase (short-subunit alcohol dehydrogenase family)
VVGIARSSRPDFPGRFHEADLGDSAATAVALERILADGLIDGVVNNAGGLVSHRLEEVVLEDFDRHLDVHLRAAVQVTQACLPGMRERRFGRIVNVSSVAALGAANRSGYSAAKAGIIGLTRAWCRELAPAGITANAVGPGPIRTSLLAEHYPPGSDIEEAYRRQIPLGRLGNPDEVAALIAFLCSEDAGYITGQVIYIDGGYSVGRVWV